MPEGSSPAASLSWPLILLLIGGAAYGTIFSANKIAIEGGFPFVAFTFYQAFIAGVVLLGSKSRIQWSIWFYSRGKFINVRRQ